MDRGNDQRYEERDIDRGNRGYPPKGRGGYRGGRSPARHPPRSPPRRNSPLRHGRTPPFNDLPPKDGRYNEQARSRSPQRRSRSPGPMREKGGYVYRGRGRSPRDERRRSPGPHGQYEAQPRERSPPAQVRERSPPTGTHRQYSPPPKSGARYPENPDEDFDRRDAPPPRDDYKRYSREGAYRPRGRSRSPRVPSHPSRGATPNSSRRSSPRSYGDRARMEKPQQGYNSRYEQTADRPSPRYPQREHSPQRRGHSPHHGSPRRPHSPGPRSPPRKGYSPPPKSPQDGPAGWNRGREGPPPRRDAEYHRERDYVTRPRDPTRTWRKPEGTPTGLVAHDDIASPAGPPVHGEPRDGPSRRSPPAGPSPSQRPDMLAAPTQPRGGRAGPAPYGRENRDGRDMRDYREQRDPRDVREMPFNGSRGRGGYSGPPTPRGGPPYDSRPPRPPSHHDNYPRPHSPPRSSEYRGPPRDRVDRDRDERDTRVPPPGGHAPPFRSNNSTSTTYPQTRFFNNTGTRTKTTNNPLGSLEKLIEGGKKFPSALDPAQEKRLQELEEGRRKLMEAIEEKQKIKRQNLREWESAERESRRDGLKAELAEGHLERLAGEGTGGGAY